ncbi:MAG: putative Ig domain-containing protein [Methanomethylovorans sp.]|uniref:putative Ig domain-containing protein n=1 Tax=Methanomethylovorans sp. TaxID=2758717 RepID=UPI0035310DB5
MKRWILVVLIAACLILATAGNGAAGTEKLDVPLYLQTDSRWSSDIMGQPGNCGSTLGDAGCAVTSTAMVFKYYGVQTDPKELNKWLRGNNGYSGCLIKWITATGMTSGKVKYNTEKYSPTEDYIKSYLSSGVPLIADLKGHFEVITGYAGSSYYYVNDPLGKDTKIPFNRIKRVIIYTGTIVPGTAQIVTQSISPTIISPNSKLTFVFSIKNPNSDSIKNVRLGAQVRTHNPVGPWIDSSANDKIVTLSPGTKDYSRTFTFINPELVSSGYYDARWVILDNKTGTWIDSETMTRIFEVKTQSQPPALTPIGDKSVSEKEKLTFRISAKDPDGDKVTYSAEGLPNGAKLTSSGLFTWTPGSGTAGKYTVKFIATANGQTDSKTITITVNKVADNPPVLASIGDKSVSEQNKLSFTLSAKDPDGDKVTYSAEGLPSGAKLTSSGLFIWTPGSGTAGKYTVKFIATANGQIDYETITITVNNPLSALPEITSITPSKTEAGTFDLTIKGKNFNSKTAVEMVYFNGKYVGQGTIKSRSSTKIVVTEKMTGTTPGVYVVKVRNNPSDSNTESNGKDITITAPAVPKPEITSITPTQTVAGTFDLTINGKNFDSKTAVDQIYFNGKYVGQGTIKSRSSTRIVVTEKMTGTTPGVYVVKVRNNPSDSNTESNGKDLTITAPAVPVTLSISPTSGQQGTTFTFSGTGYTPNGAIEWHVKRPDNSEITPSTFKALSTGTLSKSYTSSTADMVGTYTIWAIDKATGRQSKSVTETITAAPVSVSVQYQGQFAYTGWGNWAQDGNTAGTPSSSANQMEAIKIKTSNYGVIYRAHVADIGWQSYVSNGQIAGTVGQGKSLQAIQIQLQNAPSNIHVKYRVYVDGSWRSWVSDGATAGTTGLGLPVKAIQIQIYTT